MYGYIYETTNIVNDKKYIGKHKGTYDPFYLGSGTRLGRSIKKHGKDNFIVKMIRAYGSDIELNEAEIRLIKELNACESDKYYNIASGGNGGDITTGYSTKELQEFCRKSSVWNKLGKESEQGKALRKRYGSKKEKNPMYGKKRKFFSEVVLKSNSMKIKCPHCDFIGNLGNAKHWHFDNCKHKQE